MALEQERGISITSAALEFELDGRRMSLIDTPGHNDFSEDTYRALIAADSVVMVIDAANGVEDQTRKLFEVSKRHRLPILTFINKFDRPAKDPLELLDDLERTLGIHAAPVNWPDRQRRAVSRRLRHPAEAPAAVRARGAGAASGRPWTCRRSTIPAARALIGAEAYAHFRESLDVISAAPARRSTRRSTWRDARRRCSSAAR